MIDYADLYGGLESLYLSLKTILDDVNELAKDYGLLKDALPIVQEMIDDVKRRMDEVSPLLYAQEQREDADDRRDYFKAIGPL